MFKLKPIRSVALFSLVLLVSGCQLEDLQILIQTQIQNLEI